MEFEDKNVKAAVKKAAKALKISEKELQYEVISYGSTGIFGLVGAKKAKIKVVVNEENKESATVKDVTKKTPPVKEKIKKETIVAEVPEAKETKEETTDTDSRNEAIVVGKKVLQKILEKITEDTSVDIEERDDTVFFNVNGGNAAVLIGKRGQTLEAIQYIVERTVNKHSEKRIRLQIDVAGYLENRKMNLEQRALRLAEKVKRVGKPVTVGEMNVYDRKIVHLALKEIGDVRTQSMGNGFYRKLVIFPKKYSGKKRPKNSRS